MNKVLTALISGIMLLALATTAHSHDVVGLNGKPVNTHQHVWRQQAYGKDYRQGHSVNSPQGSITTWSPNTYRGYNAGSAVRFARPVPITEKPKAGDSTPAFKSASQIKYGQRSQRE